MNNKPGLCFGFQGSLAIIEFEDGRLEATDMSANAIVFTDRATLQ